VRKSKGRNAPNGKEGNKKCSKNNNGRKKGERHGGCDQEYASRAVGFATRKEKTMRRREGSQRPVAHNTNPHQKENKSVVETEFSRRQKKSGAKPGGASFGYPIRASNTVLIAMSMGGRERLGWVSTKSEAQTKNKYKRTNEKISEKKKDQRGENNSGKL